MYNDWADEWRECAWSLDAGDIVHLVGDIPMFQQLHATGHIEFTSQDIHMNRVIIFHPDILLTGTAASNALSCKRKALIDYEIKEVGGASKHLVIGNVVHEALQAGL